MTDSGLKEGGFLAEGRRIWTEKLITGQTRHHCDRFFVHDTFSRNFLHGMVRKCKSVHKMQNVIVTDMVAGG